jgi:uncharacterized OB-fold protein
MTYYMDLREHRLPYYQCGTGEHVYSHPQEFCSECGSSVKRKWSEGVGTVYSFTTLERAGHPCFSDSVPYTIALVDFPEGFRTLADLKSPPGMSRPHIGQTVGIEFEDVTDEMTFVHFVAAS